MESVNGKLRDELLNGGIFGAMKEPQIRIEAWRCHDNSMRRNSSLCQ
ncbi:MAG: transposase [Pseudorhodoplanes sp.]|nr:MAG: transposase [Pseudorhodoplanes sp.]